MSKICILGLSGGVGKTTISKHLLFPRMNQPKFFSIESINESAEVTGADISKMRGQRFKILLQELILLINAIIDIGVSNIEAFLEGLHSFFGSQKEFDYFVLPVTSGAKEMSETITLIHMLNALGVGPERIRIIFNKVERDVEDEFRPLLKYLEQEQICTYNLEATIYRNDVFDMLQRRGLTIADVLADDTDYRTLAKAIPQDWDEKQRNQHLAMYLIKSLCPGVNHNLDVAYKALFS
jgi:CO dehydrogenase nickel-insertion accessory protein CooC1